tara:strand:+ start:493 stop:795 length:303 start_codon:yes stop_codon:yes gene_type:complete
MTDAPENIWLPQCHAEDAANQPDGNGEFIEYTRTDIADAREAHHVQWVKYLADTVIARETRIDELEAVLLNIALNAHGGKSNGTKERVLDVARTALGTKT